MEFKQIRATFTGSESKPVYGLPKKTPEISESPRGSVRALVQMYENRVRENSQESERLSQRNSSVGRLSQDKLNTYENNIRDSSNEANRLSSRNSSVGRLTQDKLQPFLAPPTEINVLTRARSQTEEQSKNNWLNKLKDSGLEPISEKNDSLGSIQNKESVKKYLRKQIENPEDKKLAHKLEIKLEDLMLEQIDEKSEIFEKSVQEPSPKGNKADKVQELADNKIDTKEILEKVNENEGEIRKEHRKRDKRSKDKHREKKVEEGIEIEKRVEVQVREIPDAQDVKKTEDIVVDEVTYPIKKQSRRSKKKESQAIEASPESNDEYFISLHPENKIETFEENPEVYDQEFVIFPNYIEELKVENKIEIDVNDQEVKKLDTKVEQEVAIEVERLEENGKERKKTRKRSQKSESNDISVEGVDSDQQNPLLKYIVPAPDPIDKSKKNTLPKAPVLPTSKSSSTPSSNPPPPPFTQDELILKAPKPYIPDPIIPNYSDPNFKENSPVLLNTSPYNDFSYKKSPNPIPTEEDSLKIVILPTLPEDKKSKPPKPQSPVLFPVQPLDLTSIKPIKKESISEIIQEIDITCINCYECLRPEEINSHSLKCLKPNLEITEAMQADIRIKKMLKSISTRKLESQGTKYSLYCRLEEYSVAILEKTMNSYSIYDKIEEIYNESLRIDSGLPVTILAKRLENLLELKGEFVIQQDETDILKLYQEEAERQKKELEKWKMRSELLLQLAGNPAGQGVDIDSDLGSGRSSVISFGTGFSDYPNDVGNLEDVEQVLQAISEEELEKHFYTICIRAKIALPKHHPCSNQPVSELFKEVQHKNIPVSQWRDYINTKFSTS